MKIDLTVYCDKYRAILDELNVVTRNWVLYGNNHYQNDSMMVCGGQYFGLILLVLKF